MLGVRRLWPLISSEHVRWPRTTAPRSAASSPITISPFQTAGSLLRSDTAIDDKSFWSSERLITAIWRYVWCVYMLAGGTATDILVHFPVSFFKWLSDIRWLSITFRRIASSFRSCPQARRSCVAPCRSRRPA